MNPASKAIQEFPYYRGLSPLMWVFFSLGLIETAVVHFVVSQIWPRIGLFLSLLSGSSLLWIFFVIRSLRTHPVLIANGRLIMRCGTLKSIDIALDNIAAIRTEWESDALKVDGVLNLSLIAYPNVIVDLIQPKESRRFGRERQVRSVAHRFDDLPAFVAALTCERNIDRD